jgi:hypothetical protein
MSEIMMFEQGEEPPEFWLGLGVGTGAPPPDLELEVRDCLQFFNFQFL